MNLKTVKIGLIGECKTGKTSLARFYASNGTVFSRDYHLTSGVEVFTKILSRVQNADQSPSFLGAENGTQITEFECRGMVEHVKLKVYDFGGSPIYHQPIVFPVLEQLTDFVIVFDIGRRSSWEAVAEWLAIVREKVGSPGRVFLLGNVFGGSRQVSDEEVRKWAAKERVEYFELGVSEYSRVNEVFNQVVKTVLEANY